MTKSLASKPFPFAIQVLFLLAGTLWISACNNSSENSDSEFIHASDIQIDLVANTPDINSPVALTEDNKGQLWVVEMPGYMRDLEGNGEDIADGRIVILKDTNQDGVFDQSTVFLNKLLNPRAIALVYEGLLFTDGVNLKWTTIDGEKPGEIELVDSLYVIGGNIEHQPNGLFYNLDNWIYSAKSNVRYQKKNGLWKKEVTTFRGQWGITGDHQGRMIYNNNSTPLLGDLVMPNWLIRNPHLEIKKGNNQLYTKDLRIFPIQATAVNRGYLPEVLDNEGKVINYTSACAPHVFYGESLPPQYKGSIFVCAPEANAISQFKIDEKSFELKADRVEEGKEFLVSTEETFRPVYLHTSFDGSMYVVDLRKGVIQHRAYMSNYLREKIVERELDKVTGVGRIYKISGRDASLQKIDLSNLAIKDLPNLLFHPNIEIRKYAQKKLVHLKPTELQQAIEEIARETRFPNGQIHALWTLEGMDLLTSDLLQSFPIKDQNPEVISQLILLSAKVQEKSRWKYDLYKSLLDLDNYDFDFALSIVSGGNPTTEPIWLALAKKYPQDQLIGEALISGAADWESYYQRQLKKIPEKAIFKKLLANTLKNKEENITKGPKLLTKTYDDDRTSGLKIFRTYCTACHGIDGNGLKEMAPSLITSEIVKGEAKNIAGIILNGYDSGKEEYRIMMPAYINDPSISDREIVDLVNYLKSTYTADWSDLNVAQVAEIRKNGGR